MYNSTAMMGADGVLTVSDPQGLSADDVAGYFGEAGVVGRVVKASVEVRTLVREFHELGSHMPKELRASNVSIQGTVERAYLNGAMLKLMLARYAEVEETELLQVPSFNMKLTMDKAQFPDEQGNSVLTLYGVIFDNWKIDAPEDDFFMEHLTFRARRVSVQDVEVTP